MKLKVNAFEFFKQYYEENGKVMELSYWLAAGFCRSYYYKVRKKLLELIEKEGTTNE